MEHHLRSCDDGLEGKLVKMMNWSGGVDDQPLALVERRSVEVMSIGRNWRRNRKIHTDLERRGVGG